MLVFWWQTCCEKTKLIKKVNGTQLFFWMNVTHFVLRFVFLQAVFSKLTLTLQCERVQDMLWPVLTAQSLSHGPLFGPADGSPPGSSVEVSRQEYWGGLPCSPPGIFPTQGLNPGLLHGRQGLYPLSHQRRQAGCATVYLSIHLLKDILIASKFGQLYIKLLVDVQGYLIVIIISNSLTIYNTEHLFICLFAICLSSLMR